MKNKVIVLLSVIALCTVKANALSVSSQTAVNEKVVELMIELTPTKSKELRKQRKVLSYKAGRALCSGAFISPLGHIITARHCVEGAKDITVTTSDQKEYTASIRGISSKQDLAVIQIGKFNTPYFTVAQPAKRGQTVWILGSPLGLSGMLTSGIVSKLTGDLTFLDCTALPGNSGGPVIDSDGELVGVLTSIVIFIAGPSHISVAQSRDSVLFFFYELSSRN